LYLSKIPGSTIGEFIQSVLGNSNETPSVYHTREQKNTSRIKDKKYKKHFDLRLRRLINKFR